MKRFVVDFEGEEECPAESISSNYPEIGPIELLAMFKYKPFVEYVGPPEAVTPCDNRIPNGPYLVCRFMCVGKIHGRCIWGGEAPYERIIPNYKEYEKYFVFPPDLNDIQRRIHEMIKSGELTTCRSIYMR